MEDITELEKMRAFLRSYSYWEAGRLLYIDKCDGGEDGLFPEGVEVLSRKTDVLGNTRVHYRLRFMLYRSGTEREGDGAWLLDFQKWLAEMSIRGKAPQFGDVPGEERLRAEKGKLEKSRGNGSLYAVTLTAEFTKIYQEEENGKN
ncbi:MAG: hypothetical protein IJD63_01435 [Oscillospiraceae bacterium]|nr:hypothetical protein [Oscillospiraceae bacterium]